jgi:hypothetical protein
VRRSIGRLLGPSHRRSRDRIEIDITYECNIRCDDCNRSVGRAPSDERMDLDQVRRFIDESVASRIRWETIRIVGGEPTLHPELLEILYVLSAYQREHSPNTVMVLVTNGVGRRVNTRLRQLALRQLASSRLSGRIVVENSNKAQREPAHQPFNRAPLDLPRYRQADFGNGCWISERCGIGLTPYGYYPCAVAGSIDRVLGLDRGRKRLPDAGDGMRDLFAVFCAYCGHFCPGSLAPSGGEPGPRISPSWIRAYDRFQTDQPALTRY